MCVNYSNISKYNEICILYSGCGNMVNCGLDSRLFIIDPETKEIVEEVKVSYLYGIYTGKEKDADLYDKLCIDKNYIVTHVRYFNAKDYGIEGNGWIIDVYNKPEYMNRDEAVDTVIQALAIKKPKLFQYDLECRMKGKCVDEGGEYYYKNEYSNEIDRPSKIYVLEPCCRDLDDCREQQRDPRELLHVIDIEHSKMVREYRPRYCIDYLEKGLPITLDYSRNVVVRLYRGSKPHMQVEYFPIVTYTKLIDVISKLYGKIINEYGAYTYYNALLLDILTYMDKRSDYRVHEHSGSGASCNYKSTTGGYISYLDTWSFRRHESLDLIYSLFEMHIEFSDRDKLHLPNSIETITIKSIQSNRSDILSRAGFDKDVLAYYRFSDAFISRIDAIRNNYYRVNGVLFFSRSYRDLVSRFVDIYRNKFKVDLREQLEHTVDKYRLKDLEIYITIK